MTFVAFWTRTTLHGRWRSLVSIALLLGLLGGLDLFALAGARRTQSSFPRFLRSTNPSTMAVVIGGASPEETRQRIDLLAGLPEVVNVRAYTSFLVAPLVDGRPDLSQEFESLGSVDGRYFVQDRFTPTSGRRPDVNRIDEVAVNEEAARLYGYHVGQQLDLATVSEATVAVAALVAAITFGAGLTQMADQPRLYGWDWDVALVAREGYGNTRPAATAEILGGDHDIAAWGGAFYGADQLDGRTVPLLGMEPNSPVTPPIRNGRMIQGPGEITLGTATLVQLHKKIGDTVASGSGPLRIVGTATLPSIGQVHADHTSLGIGGIIDTRSVPGYDRNMASAPADGAPGRPGVAAADYGPNVVFVRLRPGADRAAVTGRLQGDAEKLAGSADGLVVTPVQRPAEIVNADDIGAAPTLLGIAVALAALAALASALVAGVRRRRRDLALLKSLGFTRGQLSAAVAWQATGTILVAIIIGVPLGVVVGRLLWTRFAAQLDVLAQPVVPIASIGLVVIASILAANIVSALPARYARTVPAALVLRNE